MACSSCEIKVLFLGLMWDHPPRIEHKKYVIRHIHSYMDHKYPSNIWIINILPIYLQTPNGRNLCLEREELLFPLQSHYCKTCYINFVLEAFFPFSLLGAPYCQNLALALYGQALPAMAPPDRCQPSPSPAFALQRCQIQLIGSLDFSFPQPSWILGFLTSGLAHESHDNGPIGAYHF